MNKKLIAITLSTLVLVGGITGCSNKSTSTSSDSTKTEQSADKPLKLDFVQTSRHDDSANKFSMVYDKKTRKIFSSNKLYDRNDVIYGSTRQNGWYCICRKQYTARFKTCL